MATDPAAERLATLDALADRIDATLWMASPDLRVWHFMNAACTVAYGFTAAEATADPTVVRGRFHPDDAHLVEEALATVAKGEDAEVLYRMRLNDGSYRWQLTLVYPLFEPDGSIQRIIGTGTEVTKLKDLEEQLRLRTLEAQEASRAKSAFLATMTHEIRTPMIGVTGMLEVLSHTELDADQQRTLAVVRQSADSLLQILGDVLDVSKIEAGRLELNPGPVALRGLVGGVVENLVPPASSKGLVLDLSVDPQVAPAHLADPVRIRQVLANLVSNALKFTEQGGVHVSLRVLEEHGTDQVLELAVTDTGIGIAPEHQERIFEPFTQADETTTRRFGGTGLGLNICHLIAELMDGDITMDSAVGVGTTVRFRVRLPVTDAIADTPDSAPPAFVRVREAPTTHHEAREAGTLLLLVEDHAVNRLVITKQLGLAGFVVHTADNGQAGLERWAEGGYALVFSDIHMPEMDGLDLVRALRASETETGSRRTPVIALTAATLRDEIEAALEAGMDDVMVKPTTVPALTATLRRWLPDLEWEEVIEDDPTPPPAPAAAGPVRSRLLDDVQATVAAVAGGDPEVGRELLAQLDRSTRDDVTAMTLAVAAHDPVTVAQRAHRIKGSCRTIGATELGLLADLVEVAAPSEDWVRLEALAAALSGAAVVVLDGLAGR